jgi:multidrug transporter EmrE-like cation transporter
VKYALLALAVAFNVGSYVVFKTISTRPHGLLWAALFAFGLALGAVNIFFFTAALRELGLAVAYPALSGASIALIVLLSGWYFGEEITTANLAGAVLVVLGVIFILR